MAAPFYARYIPPETSVPPKSEQSANVANEPENHALDKPYELPRRPKKRKKMVSQRK
jgi:hypothetical protein